MSDLSQKTSILINSSGDCEVDASGHLVEDPTVQSRAIVRLRGRQGEYYADGKQGSRLHQIKTTRDAERELLPMTREALKPMMDQDEILAVEKGMLETRPEGTVAADLLLQVPEGEVLRVAGLPLGSGRSL